MRRSIALLLVFVLSAAACSGSNETVEALLGNTYLSESVRENGAERTLVAGTQMQLSFRAEGEFSARAGCNSIGGTYQISGDRFEPADIFQTEMGCDPALHEQDEFLIEVLNAKPTIEVDGMLVRLLTDDVAIDFIDRRQADPDRPLIGTVWEVDGFLSGDIASSFATDSRARLAFADETTLELFDGCVDVVFDVEVDGETLRFAPQNVPAADDCAAPAGYRQSVYAAFSRGSLAIEITGPNLTLATPDRVGLTLRATS